MPLQCLIYPSFKIFVHQVLNLKRRNGFKLDAKFEPSTKITGVKFVFNKECSKKKCIRIRNAYGVFSRRCSGGGQVTGTYCLNFNDIFNHGGAYNVFYIYHWCVIYLIANAPALLIFSHCLFYYYLLFSRKLWIDRYFIIIVIIITWPSEKRSQKKTSKITVIWVYDWFKWVDLFQIPSLMSCFSTN